MTQHVLDRPSGFEALVPRRTAARVEALLDGVDVLHVHGVWEPFLRAAAARAARRGVPYLVAPHGMLSPWSLAQRRRKKQIALALGYRAMLDRAARLHVLNDYERDAIEPLRLRAQPAVIPNGVFLGEASTGGTGGALPPNCPSDRPFVLFLARLHPGKGLGLLVGAFARLASRHPSLDLVIAGPDGGARAAVERQARDLGVANRVHLVGGVYGAQKFALLSRATCFCLPSQHEAFSVSVLEALACGVPTVITEGCHFPEVSDAGAGEVVPAEPSALAAALDRFLTDPSARSRAAAAGRALVAERYTWEKVALRSIAVYDQARVDRAP